MSKKKLLRGLITEVFIAKHLHLIDSVYEEKGIFKHTFGTSLGPKGVKDFAHQIHAALPHATVVIEDVLQDGGKFAIRWRGKAIHEGEFNGFAATGKSLNFSGLATVHMPEEKIIECHVTSNIANILSQYVIKFPVTPPTHELTTLINNIAIYALEPEEIQVLSLWMWGASLEETQIYLSQNKNILHYKELREIIKRKFQMQDKQEIFEILYTNNVLTQTLAYARTLLAAKLPHYNKDIHTFAV